jgi:hypothetical protein
MSASASTSTKDLRKGKGKGKAVKIEEEDGLFISEGEPYLVDVDEEQPVLVRSQRVAEDEKETVAWTHRKMYINMYGKRSFARYRLEMSVHSPEYEDEPPTEDKVNSAGKEKTKAHLEQKIWGVAWEGASNGDDDEDLRDTLRKRWGTKKADRLIHEAAQQIDDRYRKVF